MPKSAPIRLRRLLFQLTALGLLPLALMGGWGVHSAIEQQRRELERSMLELSRALASGIDAELDGSVSTLRSMAQSPALVNADLPLFYGTATDALRAQPDWLAVILANSTGKPLFSTTLPYGDRPPRTADPDSMARIVATGTPTVGRIALGQSGRAAFPVRVPVFIEGQLAYVLTAAVKPDRFLQMVRQQNVPPSWVISVLDSTRLRVARSKDHERTVATGASPTLAALLREERIEGVGVTRTLEGEEAITAYTRSPRHGWTVVVGAPTAPLRAALIQGFATFGAAILASLALCIALAAALSGRIVRTFAALQEQAARLGRGEPVQAVPTDVREMHQMGQALQAAAAQRLETEREREHLLESLNAALARAEEAGRAKDDFLAILGHELRNPLAPIVTALDLMDLRGDPGALRERDVMRRQVNHMRRLVDDLLDISRITRGKFALNMAPVDLRDVAMQAVDAVQQSVQGPQAAIGVETPGPVWVDGDESRLAQVVSNLVSNALRFAAHEVTVKVTSEDGQAVLRVCDDGAGMTPAALAQVFQPFYQAPQSLARSSGGLGLGLAIVRGIVDLHGGEVRAESEGPGLGSTFTVRLPARAAPSAATGPQEPAATHASRRILLVDDNVDAAQSLAELLGMLGHTVTVAHDAQGALASFAQQEPELAIFDIGLPDMDGYALAQAVRTRHPDWRGPLLALTGYGQDSDKARSKAAGFDVHLTKPVDLAQLNAALG
jgi:signal transduction histidine kinase/CheY-like chemotaxis protein